MPLEPMRQTALNDSPGKTVGQQLYLHTTAIDLAPPSLRDVVARASTLAEISSDAFNVVRFDNGAASIALLNYPNFFEEAFPTLEESWKVVPITAKVTHRTYSDSLNPPILHRKELLLAPDHPCLSKFAKLTSELESLGFFGDPVRIGFRIQWERLLRERGFRVIGHDLAPIGNDETTAEHDFDGAKPIEVARHLTALTRYNLSAPIQLLHRFGLLDGSRTLFDYGCGKGDDLRGLIKSGLVASGWDPYFAPEASIASADIVNLGFVINVIEDPLERREALQRAYRLAQEVLIVSTMIASEETIQGKPFGDGVLTGRNTFQKYYTQGELRDYLGSVLGEEPVSAAPGIFIIFRDRDAEQRFQVARYRSKIRPHPPVRATRYPPAARRTMAGASRRDRYDHYQELSDTLWQRCLELGREPDASEVQNLEEIERALGSLRKALNLTFDHHDSAQLEHARSQRSEELLVMFALQLFQKRRPYKHLEAALQRDVKSFFRDYASALEQARDILHQIAQPEVLAAACQRAAEQGLGWLEAGHSLQLHASLLGRLPSVLRVYVGCAGVLYGDLTQTDLIKIHISSGKVSLLNFDDFFGSPLPKMTKRVKLNLRSQVMQVFEYGDEFPLPFLYLKSRFINEETPRYAEQLAFDESLQAVGLLDFSGFGPNPDEFLRCLHEMHFAVNCFRLERFHYVPDLDAPCGRFFTYRQLIECGETQSQLKLPNLPKIAESYTALYDLATNILEPVVEYFGGIELTYGFCSQELARHIPRGIAPELDQHAANERKRNGSSVCARLGAAVDFLVRDEDMRDVTDWIASSLPFDRLYFYGEDRPIHVSYGPDNKREVVDVAIGSRGHRVPRIRTSKPRS